MSARPPIIPVFTELGISHQGRGNTEIKYLCPWHERGGQTHNASINRNTGKWHCYNGECGASGDSIISFVAKFNSWPFERVQEWLKKEFNYDAVIAVFEEDEVEAPRGLYTVKQPKGVRPISPFNEWVIENGYEYSVLQQLDVGLDMTRDELGYYTHPGAFFIPFYHDKKLVGWCHRWVAGGYQYKKGFNKICTLYGFDSAKVNPVVYLVEGPRDVWRLRSYGLNAVAICGSIVSDRQINLILKHWKKVCIAFDGDKAGRRATSMLLKNICGLLPTYVLYLPDGLDPDGIKTKEEWLKLKFVKGEEYVR